MNLPGDGFINPNLKFRISRIQNNFIKLGEAIATKHGNKTTQIEKHRHEAKYSY
jgi:hypothetical protein